MKVSIQLKALLLVSPLFLTACKDKAEIKTTVENVYELNLIECDTKDFSDELRVLLEENAPIANSTANRQLDTTTQDWTPRRNLLTANSEGFTEFKVKNIGISYNKATALVSLINGNLAITWTDTVQLVYQKKWKIDDIKYDQNLQPSTHSLRNLLHKSKREVYG